MNIALVARLRSMGKRRINVGCGSQVNEESELLLLVVMVGIDALVKPNRNAATGLRYRIPDKRYLRIIDRT